MSKKRCELTELRGATCSDGRRQISKYGQHQDLTDPWQMGPRMRGEGYRVTVIFELSPGRWWLYGGGDAWVG